MPKAKKDDAGILRASDEISRKTQRAADLAELSAVKADSQLDLARKHRQEAEAMLGSLAKLAEAKRSLQQAEDAAKRAGELSQRAWGLALETAGAAEQGQQRTGLGL